MEGVEVLTLSDYLRHPRKYDVLVCHAPNIRNHYMFLKRFHRRFDRIIFFFHGHEVMRMSSAYSAPYDFVVGHSALFWRFGRDFYDTLKLALWRQYLPKLAGKSQFIFVSNAMLEEFIRFVRLQPADLGERCHVIYNAVGPLFEISSYDAESPKKYDFITIRGDIDQSKYGVDIVNMLALHNPNLCFLLVGKGRFFEHVAKADNLTWMEGTLSHREILELLDQCRCALMPTRLDAQGLMSCEFATYGLPLITSDIPVCQEVFKDFDNVAFISNDDPPRDIGPLLEVLCSGVPYDKNPLYFAANTVMKEIDLLKKETGLGNY
ncbi:MAG: glycosyltransferase family 4 protein [Firmicutes bacterium]|nr:glycosyltransferase family 4 protein [Bacillota bacterium]